jgi:hypothetical protein
LSHLPVTSWLARKLLNANDSASFQTANQPKPSRVDEIERIRLALLSQSQLATNWQPESYFYAGG